MFYYLDYTDVCIVNTNAPKLLNTSNRYYVVTPEYIMSKTVFLKGNCAAGRLITSIYDFKSGYRTRKTIYFSARTTARQLFSMT